MLCSCVMVRDECEFSQSIVKPHFTRTRWSLKHVIEEDIKNV